ncbi:MAG: hypothetical protein LBT58_01000 [Endomicrobium sp.]|nr:hypothetical protein [Endomicrobium sp.]
MENTIDASVEMVAVVNAVFALVAVIIALIERSLKENNYKRHAFRSTD